MKAYILLALLLASTDALKLRTQEPPAEEAKETKKGSDGAFSGESACHDPNG